MGGLQGGALRALHVYPHMVLTFSDALEYGGMPPSYFPETMPHASGDQVMAPTPGESRAE